MPNFVSVSLNLQDDIYRVKEENIKNELNLWTFTYSVKTNNTRPHAKNQFKQKVFTIFYRFFCVPTFPFQSLAACPVLET